jgi:hypothetical protein
MSEELPCKFCKTWNFNSCIKVSTQNLALRHTELDPVNPTKEEKDLYFSRFSKKTHSASPINSVIQQFANMEFQPTYVLIFTVLAWSARQTTPSEYRKQSSIYRAKAVRKLNIHLGSTAVTLECGFAFASNLLGWVAYSTCSEEVEAHVHFRGSLAILGCLIDTATNRGPLEAQLITFGPFIIDCANAWAVRHGIVPQRSTTFAQRVNYFDALSSTTNSNAWYSGTLEAANSTLGNLFEVALTSVYRLARQESEFDYTRPAINDVLHYVRAELGDPDLHKALQTLYQNFQGQSTNHTTVDGQLITRLFHRLRCVLLLLTILEAPSIHEGVTCAKSNFLARKIISFCHNQAIRRGGPIEDYYLISWHNFSHLVLGGMALSRQETPERIFPLLLWLS